MVIGGCEESIKLIQARCAFNLDLIVSCVSADGIRMLAADDNC